MAQKVSLRGVSLREATNAVADSLREAAGQPTQNSIGSSVDKKIQAEVDREMSKIHVPPHLKDK